MSFLTMNTLLFGMPGLGEWIVIGVVLVLLFGTSKIPKLGKGLGEGIRNFKEGLSGTPPKDNAESPKAISDKASSNKED